MQYLGYHESVLIVLVLPKNIVKTSRLLQASKSCNVVLEFYFKQ